MQIRQTTAQGLGFSGDWERLYDPAVNIDLGAKLLRQLWDRFKGNAADVVAAYNGGPKMAVNRIAGRPYGNQPYVDKVLAAAQRYGLQPVVVGPVVLLTLLLVWWWKRRGSK